MFTSREDNGISPSLETTDKRSRALGFSRRLPDSSSNGTSTGEGPKSIKLNQEQQKQVDLQVKAMLEKDSISLKRGIFEQFLSDQQKRRR